VFFWCFRCVWNFYWTASVDELLILIFHWNDKRISLVLSKHYSPNRTRNIENMKYHLYHFFLKCQRWSIKFWNISFKTSVLRHPFWDINFEYHFWDYKYISFENSESPCWDISFRNISLMSYIYQISTSTISISTLFMDL
jgi:hypothetical protein